MGAKPIPIEIRFWKKVRKKKPDQCWEWKGGRYGVNAAYGQTFYNGHRESAHRVSWILANGPIPDGLIVMHICDNPGCVNPAHLQLGTQKDNMIDKVTKGRGNNARGEKAGMSKLTEKSVREIRSRVAQGESQHKVAKDYGVSQVAVLNVVHGRTWAHVHPEPVKPKEVIQLDFFERAA